MNNELDTRSQLRQQQEYSGVQRALIEYQKRQKIPSGENELWRKVFNTFSPLSEGSSTDPDVNSLAKCLLAMEVFVTLKQNQPDLLQGEVISELVTWLQPEAIELMDYYSTI